MVVSRVPGHWDKDRWALTGGEGKEAMKARVHWQCAVLFQLALKVNTGLATHPAGRTSKALGIEQVQWEAFHFIGVETGGQRGNDSLQAMPFIVAHSSTHSDFVSYFVTSDYEAFTSCPPSLARPPLFLLCL
jgi:hypothetical protein